MNHLIIEGEILIPEHSSNIAFCAFDKTGELLTVMYLGGSQVYRYEFGLVEWESLKQAKSIGSYMAALAKTRQPVDKNSAGSPPAGGRVSRQVPEPGRIETALVALQNKLKENPLRHFAYSLWDVCGRPNSAYEHAPGNKLFHDCRATIVEASGSNEVGREHLPAAIALARRENR